MFALKPGEMDDPGHRDRADHRDVHQPEIHPPGPHRPLALPESLPRSLGWMFFAGWAAWIDFDRQSWAHWGLVVTSLYLALAGIAQQIVPERPCIRRQR